MRWVCCYAAMLKSVAVLHVIDIASYALLFVLLALFVLLVCVIVCITSLRYYITGLAACYLLYIVVELYFVVLSRV